MHLSFKVCQAAITRSRDYLKNIKLGFENPGVTYNSGNLAALIGAPLHMLANSGGNLTQAIVAIQDYFIGNKSAALTTVASLAFFHSGTRYDQAFAPCALGQPPDNAKNNQGHFWSAIGASLLGVGMIGLSQTELALRSAEIGMALHVGGKTGSLWAPKFDRFFKWLPLMSRAPAIASLSADIFENFVKYPSAPQALMRSILPAVLIGCNFIWARADTMLMPEGRTRRALARALLVPNR